jgi:hypothetical protein
LTNFKIKGLTTIIKKIKKQHTKALLERISVKSKKTPSAFFGKLKDSVDGLAYQKKLRYDWK